MAATPLPGWAEEDAQGPWGCPWIPQAPCSSLGTEPPFLGSSFPAAGSIKPRRVQHVPADRHQAAAKPCLDFITACCFSHLLPPSGCRRVPPRHEELAGFFCDSTAPVFGGSISALFFFPQPKQSPSPSLNALRQDSSGEMSSVSFGRDPFRPPLQLGLTISVPKARLKSTFKVIFTRKPQLKIMTDVQIVSDRSHSV